MNPVDSRQCTSSSTKEDGATLFQLEGHQLKGISISPLSHCMLQVTLLKLRSLITTLCSLRM